MSELRSPKSLKYPAFYHGDWLPASLIKGRINALRKFFNPREYCEKPFDMVDSREG